MALTEAFSGTATIGTTEYSCPNASTTLTPRTEDGVYQVWFDTVNLALGDQYQLRVYERITSGGGQRVAYEAILTGAMADSWVFPSLMLLHGWDVTVRKLAGTDRSIGWSIRQVA
jgi:hypothetical protein